MHILVGLKEWERFFFVEMEYARHRGWRGVEDISLGTKFNC